MKTYRDLPEWTSRDVARFWAKVKVGQAEECWLWTSAISAKGYGKFSLGGRKGAVVSAHRFSWALAHAMRSVPLNVCHRCDVPACVNPAHFFLGSDALNNADCVAKGRQAKGEELSEKRIGKMPRGTTHHAVILDAAKVRLIRQLRTQGNTYKQLAEQFGVFPTTIQAIIQRRTWKWLDPAEQH